MRGKPGTLVEVIDGTRKGLIGIVYNSEQEQKFWDLNKCYCHFFTDITFAMQKGKGLINIDFLKGIGKTD